MAKKNQLQTHLDNALEVVEKMKLPEALVEKLRVAKEEESQLAVYLNDLVEVDESAVLGVSQVLVHKSEFATMVAEGIRSVKVFTRYQDMDEILASIPKEHEERKAQLADDGRISKPEALRNWWVNLIKGSIQERFSLVNNIYQSVTKDARQQLDFEGKVVEAYINYRAAIGEATLLATSLRDNQYKKMEKAGQDKGQAQAKIDDYKGDAASGELQRLKIERDQKALAHQTEERKYKLALFIDNDLRQSYAAMEITMESVRQDKEVKDTALMRAASVFENNADVRAAFAVAYTGMLGTYELAETVESLKKRQGELLESVAKQVKDTGLRATEVAHSSAYDPEQVERAINVLVGYATERRVLEARLIEQNNAATRQIEGALERGKREYQAALQEFKPIK